MMAVLSEVYNTISMISVSGDDVERMVYVKEKLRGLYQSLEKEKKEVSSDGG